MASRSIVMRTSFLLLLAVCFGVRYFAQAQTTPAEGIRTNTPAVHALINARIVQAPGKVIHNGTLVIRDGYRAPGFHCQSCGYLSSKPMDTCPFCGGICEEITDAVEQAIHNVMESGGDVEVLHSPQALESFDQIGALLRY